MFSINYAQNRKPKKFKEIDIFMSILLKYKKSIPKNLKRNKDVFNLVGQLSTLQI